MKTIFRPFGMGVELTEEETAKLKKQASEVAHRVISNTVYHSLMGAAYVMRTSGNLLMEVKDASKKGAMKCFDGAIWCNEQLMLIDEGEITEAWKLTRDDAEVA